jgi:hypothetical protein
MSILVGVMLLTGGLIVVFGEIAATRELERISSWPQTRGQVESFAVSKTLAGDFFPSISYRYTVEGKEYTSDAIRPGGRLSFRSRRKAKEMEATYVTGRQVTVFYNPESPQDCCIDREETAGGSSATFWGMSIAALGAYVLFQALTQ